MCMQSMAVRPYQKWRWGGDEIVIDPIIPAARKVPGTKRTRYEIDIREYLAIEGNAVMRKKLREIVSSLSEKDRARFLKRESGCFDFRARTILNYMSSLEYIHLKRNADEWFFPEETLANKGGDCEDLAFVLAALLIESGISPYCVRVALGQFVDHRHGTAGKPWDHAWVVYFTEGGVWEILEPLVFVNLGAETLTVKEDKRVSTKTSPMGDVEYIPFFVFNRHHLWRIRSNNKMAGGRFQDYIDSRFWSGFDPRFAVQAHNHIFDEALSTMPLQELLYIKGVSLFLDVNVLKYDPRDHFDFAYIDESWKRVQENLAKKRPGRFRQGCSHDCRLLCAFNVCTFCRAAPPVSTKKYRSTTPCTQILISRN